jgi:oxygen-independent coproporphyrinogen-3 oxidase
MSAIGHFQDTYHQNAKVLRDYYAALDRHTLATATGYHMSEDDHIRKDVIMRIMCEMEVEKLPIEERYGIRFDEYFAEALVKLEPLEEDGLVLVHPDRIVVDGMGRLVVRNIAMCFDAYVDKIIREKPIFSKTV